MRKEQALVYRRYLGYVLRHKWYVFLECCRVGMPVRGLLHDLSKFRPSELYAYARYFYGHGQGVSGYPTRRAIERTYHGDVRNQVPERTAYRWTRERIQADFDLAWLRHIRRNPHHFQHYILHEDSGEVKYLPMPEAHRKEMLADWAGAGRMFGFLDTVPWYREHREHILLHPDTRRLVERDLGI